MDWPLHIYSNSVQVPVLKVKFGRLLTVTLQLADENKVWQMCICRRRSGSMELVAMLYSQLCIRGQFQDGSEDISVHCQYLTVPCILFLCCCMYCMISCVQRP